MLQSQVTRTAREKLVEAVLIKKAQQDLSWEQIAAGTGLSIVFVTAAMLGQHPLPASAATIIGKRLNLDAEDIQLLQSVPVRGSLDTTVPTDPTIYRFYEIVQVYGTTLKSLIHEKFGDGIMSAINLKITLDKIEDPEGGHRVVITLDGKYLPLRPY